MSELENYIQEIAMCDSINVTGWDCHIAGEFEDITRYIGKVGVFYFWEVLVPPTDPRAKALQQFYPTAWKNNYIN